MSINTLQDTGLFASRKRRKGEAGGPSEKSKRSLVQDTVGSKEEVKHVGSSSSRQSALLTSSTSWVAGAIAPRSEGNTHVQEAIHKEVQYTCEGEGDVPENTMRVYKFVKKAFVIPNNFEKNHKYGPLSGVSHEVRVISAYMAGQLEAYPKEDAAVKMCMECGQQGHFPRYCPSILDQ